jgi:hypothetical protein
LLSNDFWMNVSSASEPRRYLIAIGSPHCPNMGLSSLGGVKTDIERVVQLFTSEAQGYERVLADQIRPGATASTIKNALSAWFSSPERKASDCVIIYYAGHGGEEGNFGSHYLFTVDSDADNLSSTAIETSELVKCFFEGAGDRSANILLILDVCYAGQGGDQLTAALSKSQNVIKGSGFWIISSVDSRTEAADGAFVDALEEAFQDFNWMSSQDEFLNPHNFKDAINDCLKRECLKKKQAISQAEINVLRSSTSAVFIRNPNFKRNLDNFLEARQEKSKQLKNELKEILRHYNAQFSKMQQAYQATVKARSFKRRSTLETSESLITELLKIPKGQSNFTALEEFAAWLTDISTNDDLINSLQRWGEEYCEDWSDLLKQVKAKREQQEAKVQTALLIMISYSDEAATQSQYGEACRVQMWLIENIEQYKTARQGYRRVGLDSNSKLTGDETYTWEAIPDVLKQFFEQGNIDDELSSDTEVHVFLPQERLNCDADCWKLIKGIRNDISIGHNYKVFVRLYERLSRSYQYGKTWKRKWNRKHNLLQEKAANIFKNFDDGNLDDLDGFYCELCDEKNKDVMGLKLIKAPHHDSFTDIVKLISMAGLPLALWGRSNLSVSTNEAELNRILDACILERLPQTVKDKRCESRGQHPYCHIGHHLSLLWDDPDLVPPKSA